MFERFVEKKDFVEIPLSGKVYYINIDAVVKDSNNNVLTTSIDDKGNIVCWMYLWFGWGYYELSRLLAHTFKPMSVPSCYWKFLKVFYADFNPKNLHLSNLVWKFPIGLQTSIYPGFAYIPGFTTCCISKSGEVINHKTGNLLPLYINNGYYTCSIKPDMGKTVTIGRYRLLALAWLDYPANIDSLDINHINGKKTDDRLENLEWVTRKRNNQHAYDIGLRKRTPILVRNVLTDEITEYATYNECSKKLGLNSETIRQRLIALNQPIYPGYLQFKRKDCSNQWRKVEDPYTELKNRNFPKPVLVKNILTNEILKFNTRNEACRKLKLTTVDYNLTRRKTNKPLKIYLFKDIEDNSDWPIYSDSELEMYRQSFENNRNFNGMAKGYVLTDIKTGSEKILAHFSDVMEICDITYHSLKWSIKQKHVINGRWMVKYFKV